MRAGSTAPGRISLAAGLLALCLIWLGPLISSWRESFAAHMLAHMGVVAIAAPLLALGLSGHARGDCGVAWGRMRDVPLSLPILASLLELLVVWGWHAPSLRSLAERSLVATVAEQSMFLAAGLLLWISCLAAGRSGDAAHAAAGAFGLLLTTVHMTLLGALLALSPRSLYGVGEVTCFGLVLSSGQDQQLGGVFMLLVGGAVYLAGGVYLLSRVLDAPRPREEAAR